MWLRLIIFLILNFAALSIGSIFTAPGVESEWYNNLQLPPWQPPGWTFGVAWTTIMFCFSIYLAKLWPLAENKTKLSVYYGIQWLLNVGWNAVFFSFQDLLTGFIVILILTLLIFFFLIRYWSILRWISLLLLPYALWLLVAASLNGYILFFN
jgi:tryptophan-rich sensory protein